MFAMTCQQPLAWLIVQGIWPSLDTDVDLTGMVGSQVAIHTHETGDAKWYTHLGVLCREHQRERPGKDETPNSHIIGVVRIQKVVQRGRFFVAYFSDAMPLPEPIFFLGPGWRIWVWALPTDLRLAVQQQLSKRGAA